MNYTSTKDRSLSHSLSQALLNGMTPDHGLYMPSQFPKFKNLSIGNSSFSSFASQLLAPYFEKDPLQTHLDLICQESFDFPLNIRKVTPYLSLLELFHGPTAAFKDYGARFLASCLSHLALEGQNITILVATSGDTGGAVASAFYQKPGIRVKLLFPKGKVSPLQEQQLTCWGENIESFRVNGNFDDCQRMVKSAFLDSKLKKEHGLSSANSINIGRLLPQMAYHAYAAQKKFEENGQKTLSIVPSGNLGNVFGVFWAQTIGFPIEHICLATNANRVIPDFFSSGHFQAKESILTLANAMDVGHPSNLERIRFLVPEHSQLTSQASSYSVSDQEIQQEIKTYYRENQAFICPHTAVGTHVARQYFAHQDTLVSATAHPSKFNEVLHKTLSLSAELPQTLSRLGSRKRYFKDVSAQLTEIF